MRHDDLERPIKPRARRGVRKIDVVPALAIVAVGALAVAALWAVLVKDPFGGEPLATASIERRAPERPAGHAESKASDGKPAAPQDHADAQPEMRDGVPIVRPGQPMPKTGPVIIKIPGADDDQPKREAGGPAVPPGAVETAMLEDSRYGKLPRVAADGRRPLDAYARRGAAAGPRVALVVGGLGVGKEQTAAAIGGLPPEVTLAFAPYPADVGEMIAAARKAGHEVLLQAPMEPFAYPQNDPGPQTLLTSLPAAANLERLRWALGRASGYVGVAPLAGDRFLAADDALSPVFIELARRGLMFVGQGGRDARFAGVAERSGLAAAAASAPVDQVPDAAAIDAALADLERTAKAKGVAVGWAGASPLTLKRIEAWRVGLKERGVSLAPVTAALKPEGPS